MKESAEGVKPYDLERPKGEQVEEMFDNIAPAYDFMNTAMTFGMHRRWRDKALRRLKASGSGAKRVIDLATGTGDVAFALSRLFPEAEVTGVDLSEKMLEVARKKNAGGRITFEAGDCLNLRFEDGSFDMLTIAYGVRNFENLEKGFREFHRILKRGGRCMILELSRPENPVVRLGYDIYSRGLIPLMGKLVSKDTRAYTYLPESIKAMPPRSRIAEMLREAGFSNVEYRGLTLGVVTYYIAER